MKLLLCKRWGLLFFGVLLLCLQSCAGKKSTAAKPEASAIETGKPALVVSPAVPVENKLVSPIDVKAVASPSPEAIESAKVPKFFFSDVQILTETSIVGPCAEEKKLAQEIEESFQVNYQQPTHSLQVLSGPKSFKYFDVNVTVQAIGFDTSKYTFSALDGRVPSNIPYGMSFRRRPGNILALRFLDQDLEMKPFTAPIYTFQATETRGPCKLNHNVNVFLEHSGYFPAEK